MNTIYFFTIIALGLSIAGSVLIGREIGAFNIKQAKTYRSLIKIIGFIISILLATSLYVFKKQVGLVFTNIDALLKIIEETLSIVAMAQFFDSI